MQKKLLFRRTLVWGCLLLSAYYFVWGPHGLARYTTMNQKLKREKNKVERLSHEIVLLQNSIDRCKTNTFELEKVARYDLSLGYTNEIICVLSKK